MSGLELLSWALLVSGSVFCVIGGVGLLRMPDFYTRTHAASVTDTLGAGLLLAGLILQDWACDSFPFPHDPDGSSELRVLCLRAFMKATNQIART